MIVRVERISFVGASLVLAIIGGKFTTYLTVISFIAKIIQLKGWEKNILGSVFGNFKVDKQTIKEFKQRISYLGLY